MDLPTLHKNWWLENKGSASIHTHKKERVLQFGTGVLLRGLPDYYLQKANDEGNYQGSVVVVKTTEQGTFDSFKKQDYLFTHLVKGIEKGQKIDYGFVNSTISRILQAKDEWEEILTVASDPDIRVILSNVTEQGLNYREESIYQNPPVSFPAKLLACLYHRYQNIGEQSNVSMIILPTELVENNGSLLQQYVEQGAEFNRLGTDFLQWMHRNVFFSNTLVDRIVPGKPEGDSLEEAWQKLGYIDHNLLVSEPYHLWAIEKKEGFEDVMSWCLHDPQVKWVENIEIYKELKLRLLNAVHILSCGYALNSGFTYVSEAMENNTCRSWIHALIAEVKKSIPIPIDNEEINHFARHVEERFANPFLKHAWASIMMNYTDKMRIRAVPLLINFYNYGNGWPEFIIQGWAMYFLLSTPDTCEEGKYYRKVKGKTLTLQDPASAAIWALCQEMTFSSQVLYRLKHHFFSGTWDDKSLEVLHSAIMAQLEYLENKNIIHHV